MRVIRANLNSLVSKAEDPEKILEQAVLDMQEDLIQLRQAVAQAIATQNGLSDNALRLNQPQTNGTVAPNLRCRKGMKTWREKP